jgi:outer membrane protein OmpA-like peptidoglycan-associated protein
VITVVRKRREQIEDYEIERFSLILFDFDKAEIVGSNSKVVDFIASRTRPESQIEIRGYTDRTGDEMYNQQLSERRALATKAALNRSDAVAIGIGERQLLYDNDLPEGRFYCRTVQVTVKTKVK